MACSCGGSGKGVKINIGRVSIRQYVCKNCHTINRVVEIPTGMDVHELVRERERLDTRYSTGEQPEHIKSALRLIDNRITVELQGVPKEGRSLAQKRADAEERRFLKESAGDLW